MEAREQEGRSPMETKPAPPAEKPHLSVTNTTSDRLIPAVLHHVSEGQKEAPRLFTQHGGVLVRLRDNGRGPLEALTLEKLRVELARAIEFRQSIGKNDYVVVEPPYSVVSGILNADRFADYPELPELRRVVEAPFFTKAGDLVTTPGYHEPSRTYLRPSRLVHQMEPVPAIPTLKDVEAAKQMLLGELLVDFPLAGPASRAHMLALLITPFIRDMLSNALVPMAAIIAPTPGSGKSKLANVASLIFTGSPVHTMSGDIQREETEKRITALLLEGAAYGLFDNAAEGGRIDSPQLAAMLTSEVWKGRLLGKSQMLTLPNTTLWIVTGNCLEFTDEMARRSLTIALTPKGQDGRPLDKPHERTGFKHDPLDQWIKDTRPVLVRSVLTLVQHWIAQGRPLFTVRTLGSFESFAQVVGGVLQAAGLDEGFLTPTVAESGSLFRVPTDADSGLNKLIGAWHQCYGFSPRRAGHLLDLAPTGLFRPEGDKGKQLGRLLQKHSGRVIGGWRIVATKVKDEEGRPCNGWFLADPAHDPARAAAEAQRATEALREQGMS